MDECGSGEILLTSMDRDGTRDGYDIALTRAIADAVRIPVIASGGVGTLAHLLEGAQDRAQSGRGGGSLKVGVPRIHFRGRMAKDEAADIVIDPGVC